MAINLETAKKYALIKLKEDFKYINFKDRNWDNNTGFDLTVNSCSLTGIEDDIYIYLNCGANGISFRRVVFDKVDTTEEVLKAINKFNNSQIYFRALIDEKEGFLSLDNTSAVTNDEDFSYQAVTFMYNFVELTDNQAFMELIKFTKR